jgi:PKD domain
MKVSIPVLLSTVVAAAGVVGLGLVALATDAGKAPGSGEQVFDAPGCLPSTYAGPGHKGQRLLNRDCPTPTAVILRQVLRSGKGWRVNWDGSRSFDPMGGSLVGFAWSFDGGPLHKGRRVSIRYTRPGTHTAVLRVTDDSGLTGGEEQTMVLR